MGRSDSTGETRLMNAREGWNPVANAAPIFSLTTCLISTERLAVSQVWPRFAREP